MDKGRRTRLTTLKFKKRLRKMNLLGPGGKIEVGFYCFKNQGKPCSCPMCRHQKYKRKIKHKNKRIEDE